MKKNFIKKTLFTAIAATFLISFIDDVPNSTIDPPRGTKIGKGLFMGENVQPNAVGITHFNAEYEGLVLKRLMWV